ncbi:MAG: TonB-dependent receptor plug domain-containing protein, partial [Wenzhouxiangella sp.]|nr:TonB-dependent receptor plug domain-containing protein [Wenzhouxiangella sp.]
MRILKLIAFAGATFGASMTAAQDRADSAEQSEAVDLETIEVVDTEPPAPAYLGFDPVDSGRSVLERESIRSHETGDGDMLDPLRLLPNISFDVDQQSVDREDLQDLRPSDISISGAQFYDNNIRIDGVGVNNLHDVTNDNPFNFNEVAGSASQTIFVDPALIEVLDVQDSNISARYGDFTGGVVDAVIRDPLGTFGGTVQYG